mmetsp:Transcript_135686/g.377955  ORF Transcript_135686/g.377955 Transcript_135686/m.377955 type:complete len:260 (-) Transcript_135686:278-1057(-)
MPGMDASYGRQQVVCKTRPNRWTKEQPTLSYGRDMGGGGAGTGGDGLGAAGAASADIGGSRSDDPNGAKLAHPGVDPAVVALQLVLPHLPELVLRQALEAHDLDADAALESLLADPNPRDGEDGEHCKLEPSFPHEHDAGVQQPQDLAASAVDQPWEPSPAAAAEMEPPSRPFLGGSSLAEGERQRPAPAELDKPQPPPWLPMLTVAASGGVPGAKKSLYDLQTDRLKAALGPSPAAKSMVGPSQDFHKGGGRGRVGGS